LKDENKISRDVAVTLFEGAPGRGTFFIFVLSLIGLTTLSLFSCKQSKIKEDNASKVEQYLIANELTYDKPLSKQGDAYSGIRKQAYNAINEKNFAVAVLRFSEMRGGMTTEDDFHQAYVQMRVGDYNTGAAGFKKLVQNLYSKHEYAQEARLYYGLCLFFNKDPEYDTYFNSLDNNSWANKQLQTINN